MHKLIPGAFIEWLRHLYHWTNEQLRGMSWREYHNDR